MGLRETLITRAAGCASMRPVERHCEDATDERLNAVDAKRQPFAGERVEQFVHVRARDASERKPAPRRE